MTSEHHAASADSSRQADRRALITKTIIDQAEYAKAGQYVIVDIRLGGFCLRIGRRTKTFTLRREFRREGKRVSVQRALGLAASLGKRSKELITVAQARSAAIKLTAQLGDGIDPRVEKAQETEARRTTQARGITYAEAIDLFDKSNAKGRKRPRSPKTVARYAQFVRGGYLAAWMDRPLRDITRKEVRERHESLTQEVAAGRYRGKHERSNVPHWLAGKQTADDVFRWFRAVYNRALREDDTLPTNPCINIEWHNVKPKRTAIPSTALARWHEGVLAIPNPVRRDYLLFVLLSGLRRESAACVRWGDVDWARKVLRVPKPKGGEERAFDLPLSDRVLALLASRREENPRLVELQLIPADSAEWVFPAFSTTGHIAEPRERIEGVPFAIHDLRRTFITVAESLDVSSYAIGALVNHRQPGGSVTAGYVAHEVERLRAPMQQITDRLLELLDRRRPKVGG